MSVSNDGFITQLNASQFMAQRAIDAETMPLNPPQSFVLPGSLVPIAADRLEAHQDDGLSADEIVEYENVHFLQSNVRIRERHAQWVGREYDAMVQANREMEVARRRREAESKAAYQRRIVEILAERDANA